MTIFDIVYLGHTLCSNVHTYIPCKKILSNCAKLKYVELFKGFFYICFLQQKSEDTKGVVVTRSLKSAFNHKGCAGMTFSNVNVTGSNVHTCIPGKNCHHIVSKSKMLNAYKDITDIC